MRIMKVSAQLRKDGPWEDALLVIQEPDANHQMDDGIWLFITDMEVVKGPIQNWHETDGQNGFKLN